MQRIKEICDQLQVTNSSKEKEQILKDNSDNKDFKYILNFLLNPFIITGLSNAKINKVVDVKKIDREHFYKNYSAKEILEYIQNNNTGTDINIGIIQRFISHQSQNMDSFYKQLFTKSLKLGLDAKTANKVYGDGFIPTFDVMLGTSIEKCKIPEGDWFSISHKLNGSRCLFYKGDLYTRSGKKYTGVEHIINDLKRVLINSNIVVDGELVRKNTDNLSDSANFQVGVGIRTDELRMFTDNKMGTLRTITECGNKGILETNFRIRKLTPKECFRLMGFTDADIENCQNIGISDTQLYKQAGNSIVTDVLFYIMLEIYKAMPYLFEDIKLGSFFSGIGAFEIALNRLYETVINSTTENFTRPQVD